MRLAATIVLLLLLGGMLAYAVLRARSIRLFGIEIFPLLLLLLVVFIAGAYIAELPQYSIRADTSDGLRMNEVAAEELRKSGIAVEGEEVEILDAAGLRSVMLLLCRYQVVGSERTSVLSFDRNFFGWMKPPWIVPEVQPKGWSTRIIEGCFRECVYEITLGESELINADGFEIFLTQSDNQNHFRVNLLERRWSSRALQFVVYFLIYIFARLFRWAEGNVPEEHLPIIKRWHRGDAILEITRNAK